MNEIIFENLSIIFNNLHTLIISVIITSYLDVIIILLFKIYSINCGLYFLKIGLILILLNSINIGIKS